MFEDLILCEGLGAPLPTIEFCNNLSIGPFELLHRSRFLLQQGQCCGMLPLWGAAAPSSTPLDIYVLLT